MRQLQATGDVGDDYILNRDWRAVARPHHRHMLFRTARGYILHPKVQLTPGAKIADIGAGTCIWAVDVVRDAEFPVSVDAIDISMAQCPPKSWLPESIKSLTHDIYQPFPSSMLGKYDLVNIQNWLCIWKEETSRNLIRNLLGLLKPGGLIQWSEQNPDVSRIVVAPGVLTSTNATEEVLSFLMSPRSTISFEWVSQLGDILSRYAAVVAFDRYPSLKEHQLLWNIDILQAAEEFCSNLEQNGQSNEDTIRVAGLRGAIEGAAVEMLAGVGISSELVVAVAKKKYAA